MVAARKVTRSFKKREGIEPSRTRTCDPLVKSQLLYQLSYRPTYMQRARIACSFARNSEGILPNAATIVQNPAPIDNL